MLSQLFFSSLVMGSIYGLIGLAMVMIYKGSEIPNFAQGEMAVASTYLYYVMVTATPLPIWSVLILTGLFAAAVGLFFQWALLRRARTRTTLDLLLLTLGYQFILHGLVGLIWGPDQREFSLPVSNQQTVTWAGVTLSHLDLLTFATALCAMLGLYQFFKTRLGLALRASQQNPFAARFNGISQTKMECLTWGLSSAIGCLVGLLLAPVTSLDPNLLWDPMLKGFAGAVLGGLHSLPGAVVGGFVLALLENLCGSYLSSAFKSVLAFAVIVVVLWLRPQGLFGQVLPRKV